MQVIPITLIQSHAPLVGEYVPCRRRNHAEGFSRVEYLEQSPLGDYSFSGDEWGGRRRMLRTVGGCMSQRLY